MGYYKEQLELAKENNINVIDLSIADEVKCIFNKKLSDDDFETACVLIKNAYLKSEYISINQLTKTLNTVIDLGIYKLDAISPKQLIRETYCICYEQ